MPLPCPSLPVCRILALAPPPTLFIWEALGTQVMPGRLLPLPLVGHQTSGCKGNGPPLFPTNSPPPPTTPTSRRTARPRRGRPAAGVAARHDGPQTTAAGGRPRWRGSCRAECRQGRPRAWSAHHAPSWPAHRRWARAYVYAWVHKERKGGGGGCTRDSILRRTRRDRDGIILLGLKKKTSGRGLHMCASR